MDMERNEPFEALADLAVQALLLEVLVAPKPGLVDRKNTGAHRDMDLPLFVRSAFTLKPYFHAALVQGAATEAPPKTRFLRLREAGKEAERVMLRATEGVNTHKGAIFTFGLVLLSLGSFLGEGRRPRGEEVLQRIPLFVEGLLEEDFPPDGSGKSHGEVLHRLHGATGVRGEAAKGYPALARVLEPYRRDRMRDAALEPALLHALLGIMAELEDTNVLHRGGVEGLRFMQEEARRLLLAAERDLEGLPAAMAALDQRFIARGLSPGGAADLLGVLLFLELSGLL